MRCFSPDTDYPTGEDASRRPVGAVPSDMDNDPNADEEIIDQQAADGLARDEYPRPADAPKIVPDNLADSIAYALDGSGPGPTNHPPSVSDHTVVTKGTTGAGLREEAENERA